jgi:hypothetical protein
LIRRRLPRLYPLPIAHPVVLRRRRRPKKVVPSARNRHGTATGSEVDAVLTFKNRDEVDVVEVQYLPLELGL